MAGHAPEILPPGKRWVHWLIEASDLRLSVFMLATALAVATVLYLLNQRFLA